VAHGSSLRALVSLVSNLSQDEINNFDIPPAIPIILTLDEGFKISNIEYLAEQNEIR
jgi:bisphosphoglycerate-dependent phosphoglycerate mutase